jgi:RNA polymerase-interacting CarD/CdnL/TRCF family regulator
MAAVSSPDNMNPGDLIVHRRYGVGRVVSLESRDFNDGSPQIYYKIAIPTGTVWVPVDGSSKGLRKLTAKEDLDRYRATLSSRPSRLPQGYRERQIALLDRLKLTSFEARCEVLRDLSALGWHKRLNEGNASLLRTAHRDVCAEWAAAAGVTVGEAGAQIGSLLLEGKKLFDT